MHNIWYMPISVTFNLNKDLGTVFYLTSKSKLLEEIWLFSDNAFYEWALDG